MHQCVDSEAIAQQLASASKLASVFEWKRQEWYACLRSPSAGTPHASLASFYPCYDRLARLPLEGLRRGGAAQLSPPSALSAHGEHDCRQPLTLSCCINLFARHKSPLCRIWRLVRSIVGSSSPENSALPLPINFIPAELWINDAAQHCNGLTPLCYFPPYPRSLLDLTTALPVLAKQAFTSLAARLFYAMR